MKDNKSFYSRRNFLSTAVGFAASTTLIGPVASAATTVESPLRIRGRRLKYFSDSLNSLSMPALPYANTDLAPVISSLTLDFHYGKHTKAYYDNLNKLILNTPFATMSLEQIIKETMRDTAQVSIYNNAAQAINHSFYFAGLKGGGGGLPPAELLDLINASFVDYATFKTQLISAATGRFGSGWVWLILTPESKLAIMSTANADSPINTGAGIPLLALDVWEHAYYLDYQNLRAKHITSAIDSLINWNFVLENYKAGAAQLVRTARTVSSD